MSDSRVLRVKEALLPCFKCGKTVENVFEDAINQPYQATEFHTYGHYGSTFWDPMDEVRLVLNVCDDCLEEWSGRLAKCKDGDFFNL